MNRLVPTIIDWLLKQGSQLNQSEREAWLVRLRSLQHIQQSALQARIDLLILILETVTPTQLVFLASRLNDSPEQFASYGNALETALQALPIQQQRGIVIGLIRTIATVIRSKPENKLTLGSNLWPCAAARQDICTYVWELFSKHTQLRQNLDVIDRWQQHLEETGMPRESFELRSYRFDRTTPLQEIVQQCAKSLSANRPKVDPIIAGIKNLLQSQSLDFVEFMHDLREELRTQKMPDEEIALIEAKLIKGNRLADAYLRHLVPVFSADLERLSYLLPLMKDRLEDREIRKLLKLLRDTADKHRSGWFGR